MFFKDFGCTLCRQLSDSHFQVRSFVKHLLWHQNYFGMDYPPAPPPIMPYTPINIEIFSPSHPLHPPLFNILKTPYLSPFVNGVGGVGGDSNNISAFYVYCFKVQFVRSCLFGKLVNIFHTK